MKLAAMIRTLVCGTATILVTAACSLAPTSKPSAIPEPPHYGANPSPAKTASAQGVAQTFTIGAQPIPQWWRTFESSPLNALVDEALRNNATLETADRQLKAAREQLHAQIGGNALPNIDAGGLAARQRVPGIPATGSDTFLYDVFVGQLQVRYAFDIFGAARLTNAALASRVNVQTYQFNAARRALAANTVTAVISAAMLDAQVKTTERLIALAAEQVAQTRRRYELGAVSQEALLDAKRDAASLEASLPALRQHLLTTRHALAVLLGRTPDQAPAALDLASLHVPEELPVTVPSQLLKTRPDIAAATAMLEAAADDAGAATAQLFPSLTLTALIGQGGLSWPTVLSGAGALWSVGTSLTQPLFHGGALRAQRRAKLAAYDAAQSQYRQTVLIAFQNVADTLAALEHDAQALNAASNAAAAARRSFDMASTRYQLGAVSVEALRTREQQYRHAQLEELSQEGARLADTAMLFQAMGEP